jgi:hypothetical protein
MHRCDRWFSTPWWFWPIVPVCAAANSPGSIWVTWTSIGHDHDPANEVLQDRILPLTGSVLAELRLYRCKAGALAPQSSVRLFWHGHFNDRYTPVGLDDDHRCHAPRRVQAPTGRTGPRVHDLRHSMVVNRILQWYRSGVNPQDKLHFLSTYMGHRDINSTLVYITVTQDLLQEASELPCRRRPMPHHGGAAMTKGNPFPLFAGVLPGMAGRATQCFGPYDPVLSRHLAAVAAVHRRAKRRRGRAIALAAARQRFARSYRHERGRTAIARLAAAIRSFFSFVADRIRTSRNAQRSDRTAQAGTDIRAVLSRAGGSRAISPSPIGRLSRGMRDRVALVPVQQRADPGSA